MTAVTIDDLNEAKEDVDYISLTVESMNDTEVTPDGTTKYTITGINNLGLQEINTFTESANTALASIEDSLISIENDVESASDSADSAAESAESADINAKLVSSLSNFKGKWSNATGTSNIPASYWHDGNNWQQLVDITDVTTSEPTPSNSDWQIIVTPSLTNPNVVLDFTGNIAEKVSGSFDFERLSESTVINKSGVLETIGIDEPAISSDGINLYESYTNELLYSEDFSESSWTKSEITVESSSILDPAGSTGAYKLTPTTVDASHYIYQNITGELSTQYCLSYFVKAGEYTKCKLVTGGVSWASSVVLTFDLASGTVITGETSDESLYDVEELNNGWYRLSIMPTVGASTATNLSALLLPMNDGEESTFVGNGSSGIYAYGAQLTEASQPMPYIATTSTTVTRSEDLATIPLISNMPPVGESFTIIVDCDIPNISKSCAFSINGSEFALWRFAANGNVILQGSTSFIPNASSLGLIKYAVVFDGSKTSLYADGVFYDSDAYAPVYDVISDTFRIGQANETGANKAKLNSTVKRLEIFHSALSAAEIASRGAPK